ncbi:hypothetical protein [Micromonospora saelicesensis]
MDVADVETVLTEAGIALPSPVPATRRIDVQRLRVNGVKNDGTEFTIDRTIGPGVWAIMFPKNFVGKTSLLEFLVWALRGAPREIAPDVRAWVRRIIVDVVVSGQAVRVILVQGSYGDLSCSILSAGSADELVTGEDDSLHLLAEAEGEAEIEKLIGTFMMEALGLGYTSIWDPTGGLDGGGASQNHGWAAYFGACYLNHGGNKLLLGDIANLRWLPAKLLDLFIGLPYAGILSSLNTAQKRLNKTARQAAHRAESDRTARQDERKQWQDELSEVRKQLEHANRAADPLITDAIAAVDSALDDLRAARLAHADAEELKVRADQACLLAGQQVMDAKETWQARRVLGLLDPDCCPRCEEPIEPARHDAERQDASCAVCARPMRQVDEEFAEARIHELEEELAGQQEARGKAKEDLAERTRILTESQRSHNEAVQRLDEVRVATAYRAQRDLEIRAARLEGQLQATGSPDGALPEPTPDATEQVLAAVIKVLGGVVKEAADYLFPELDRQIVALARDFGVPNLDSVDVKRNGNLNAVKGGEKTAFPDFQPGERLRVRIAMVIAMLRVSTQRGVPAHPGLLLIDAIGSEEVTTSDATRLVRELNRLSDDLPGLQVILTTAKPEYIGDVLPEERIITSKGDYMF